MNAERTFVVSFPFFLASGALHIEDVLELFVSGDPLGIRGRLGLFYARATFKRAREVEEAAAAISAERPPEGSVSGDSGVTFVSMQNSLYVNATAGFYVVYMNCLIWKALVHPVAVCLQVGWKVESAALHADMPVQVWS